MDWLGKSLGRYRIKELLGTGGIGDVYRAYDPVHERRVVVKIISPSLTYNVPLAQQIQMDAKVVSRLNHPNIVQIYDVVWEENVLYIVMEYLTGGTLAERFLRREPLHPEYVIDVLTQVASGLDYAHHDSLIHRNLKPSNILFDTHGQVRLSDFGLLKDVDNSMVTSSGRILSTPLYLAPEQIEGEIPTPQTDIYALGVICYQMLAGKPPFQGTRTAILSNHMSRPPRPLHEVNPNISLRLEEVVLKALAKNSTERFSSARAFVEALNEAYIRREEAKPDPMMRTVIFGLAFIFLLLALVIMFYG